MLAQGFIGTWIGQLYAAIFPGNAILKKRLLGDQSGTFDAEYLARLVGGEVNTEERFRTYFRVPIEVNLRAHGSGAHTESLSEIVLREALRGLRTHGLKNSSMLPQYVHAFCRRVGRETSMRPSV